MDIKNILAHVDHTLLAVDATGGQIDRLCDEAAHYGTASVCVAPAWIERAAARLEGKVAVCTVVGFPTGYMTPEAKAAETADAVKRGADEIDMVINIGRAKQGDYDYIAREIDLVRKACPGKVLKVIIETCLLTDEEKLELCAVVRESGADYIKTSTGFSKHGATPHDVELLVRGVEGMIKVKAAGGIRSLEDAQMYLDMGADRLGTSAVVRCVRETEEGADKSPEAPKKRWFVFSKRKIPYLILTLFSLAMLLYNLRSFDYDFNSGSMTIADYEGFNQTEVTVPNRYFSIPVEGIGKKAFRYTYDVESVTLPDSIEFIDEQAFYGCDNLAEITLPDGLKIIDREAFARSGLQSVVIPGSVERLEEDAFQHCTSLTEVTILEGVTKIKSGAFSDCSALESLTLPDGLRYIDDSAFSSCTSLREVVFPATSYQIGEAAFMNCESLEQAHLGYVTIIGISAFSGCSNLREIEITDCWIIGEFAFVGCESLEKITLPEDIWSIGYGAFSGCPATIYAPHEPEWYGLTPGDYDGEWVIIGQ